MDFAALPLEAQTGGAEMTLLQFFGLVVVFGVGVRLFFWLLEKLK